MSHEALRVNCPVCKKQVIWSEQSSYRPFCSERCKQIDLGEWASESYGIPAEPAEQWSGDNSAPDSNRYHDDNPYTNDGHTLQ